MFLQMGLDSPNHVDPHEEIRLCAQSEFERARCSRACVKAAPDQYTALPERDGCAALGIPGAATDGAGVGVAVAGVETHLLRRQVSSAKLACPRTETYSLR